MVQNHTSTVRACVNVFVRACFIGHLHLTTSEAQICSSGASFYACCSGRSLTVPTSEYGGNGEAMSKCVVQQVGEDSLPSYTEGAPGGVRLYAKLASRLRDSLTCEKGRMWLLILVSGGRAPRRACSVCQLPQECLVFPLGCDCTAC